MELVLWSSSHSLTSHSTLGICKQASVQFDVCADTGSLETEILSLAWADFDWSSYTAVSPSPKKPHNHWHPLHEDIMRNEVIMVIRCIEPFQGKAIWKHRFSSFTGECLLLLDAAKQWTLLSSCFCPSQESPYLFGTVIEGWTRRATAAAARLPSAGEMWTRSQRWWEPAQAFSSCRLVCMINREPMYCGLISWIKRRKKSEGFAARQHKFESQLFKHHLGGPA